MLKTKTLQLGLLRASGFPRIAFTSTDDYREVFQGYLNLRRKLASLPRKNIRHFTGVDAVALQTLQQLDELDARREQTRPETAHSG